MTYSNFIKPVDISIYESIKTNNYFDEELEFEELENR